MLDDRLDGMRIITRDSLLNDALDLADRVPAEWFPHDLESLEALMVVSSILRAIGDDANDGLDLLDPEAVTQTLSYEDGQWPLIAERCLEVYGGDMSMPPEQLLTMLFRIGRELIMLGNLTYYLRQPETEGEDWRARTRDELGNSFMSDEARKDLEKLMLDMSLHSVVLLAKIAVRDYFFPQEVKPGMA